jgi:ABC-type multidrug transport system fused ATPase/permease subunit
MAVTNADVFKWFWRYVKLYKWPTLACIASTVFIYVTAAIIPLFYKRVFDAIGEGVKTPEAIHGLFVTIGIIGILIFFRWVFYRITGFLLVYVESRVLAKMDEGSFSRILDHSYAFFANNFAGTLTRRVKRFSDAFERLLDALTFIVIPLAVTASVSLAVLFLRNVWLGVGMAFSIAAILAANFAFARWRMKFDLVRAQKDSIVSGALTDAFANVVNIKTFARKRFEEDRFHGIRTDFLNAQTKSWNLGEISFSVQSFVMIFVEVGIMAIAIVLWRDGALTVGDFALIQSYLISLFSQLLNVGNLIRRIYESAADAREAVEIFEQTPDIRDVHRAKDISIAAGAIAFDRVSFNYHKTRKTIDGLSLDIRPGERVAFVGPSGAGKSTLAKLLLRFYDVDGGHIRVDGNDIRRMTQESLRRAVAFVPQDPILFHRTIGENIRYAQLDATQEELEKAAKLAHCHEFIVDLPLGYQTFVGERGIKLSGGERQRVAIARAILKNAPILVLDEATSSLDSESEAYIQDALQSLMKGRTTIAIAHRLSTIMAMDRIIVLQNGKIEDEGTHEELLARDGLYKNLWNIQAGGFLVEEEEETVSG